MKLDRVNHAYLFTGPRGTGKTSTARLMAKAINCLNPKGSEPCNECEICMEINDGRLIDLIEIDAASNRGIDEIRDLKEKINFAPTRAKKKIYIIDEVHMLTKEAFNALLKTLEEPPEHVYFILATTEVHKIPETILSRCQRFDFRRIDDAVLVDRLKYIASEEGIEADEKALSMIAHHSEGGMRDSIGLLEQLTADNKLTYDHVCQILGVSGIASIEKLYEALIGGDAKAGMDVINDLHNDGFDLNYFTKRFLEYLRKKMVNAVAAGNGSEVNTVLAFIDNFQFAHESARFAVIAQLPLEMAVVKSCVAKGELKPVAVVQAVKIPVAPTPKTEAVKHQEPKAESESIPVKKSAPENPATATEKAVDSSQEPSELSLDEIKKKWTDFLEHIKSPIVKRSLHQTAPLKVHGSSLVLAFGNNFHKEKVMETDNRNDMEKAFEDFFGHQVKIEGEIHQIATDMIKKKLEENKRQDDQPIAVSNAGTTPAQVEQKSTMENEIMDIFF